MQKKKKNDYSQCHTSVWDNKHLRNKKGKEADWVEKIFQNGMGQSPNVLKKKKKKTD